MEKYINFLGDAMIFFIILAKGRYWPRKVAKEDREIHFYMPLRTISIYMYAIWN